jgi:hypothetical protein
MFLASNLPSGADIEYPVSPERFGLMDATSKEGNAFAAFCGAGLTT